MKKMILNLLLLIIVIYPLKATDFPEIKGWKSVGEEMSFNPENLYEYINGAADQFLDYGFKILLTQDIAKNDLQITVDIYDMGTTLNAYGIYKTERPREAEGLKVGIEGIVSPPYQCLLLKDRYYIKVNAFEGEVTSQNGKELLAAIDDAIPGIVEFPTEIKLLPTRGMIPGSESYTRLGFLGLPYLNYCVHAKYKDENEKEFQYFVLLAIGENTTKKIWDVLTLGNR